MSGQNILVAASIAPGVFVSQQLGTSEAAVYTTAANTSMKISTASLCNVSNNLIPVVTLGTAGSGGTFAGGTYYWKVVGRSANGTSMPSAEVSATLAANATQPLTWPGLPGGTSYDIYRGTAPGAENVLVATVVSPTYTDTGAAGTSATPPTVSAFAVPVTVYLSLVPSGGTMGDGTHRVINNYSLAANDTLSLNDILGGAMLGPGDFIAAYAVNSGSVDLVLTGTVHS